MMFKFLPCLFFIIVLIGFFMQLQKVSDEQKIKIQKTERALKVAEVME